LEKAIDLEVTPLIWLRNTKVDTGPGVTAHIDLVASMEFNNIVVSVDWCGGGCKRSEL
jgi:hypothetical protein